MQPCWYPGCDMDGITEVYYERYDRMYPVCDKHRGITDLKPIAQEFTID